jgi:hypothetical protein
MRIRGMVKLIALIILCNQALTAIFSYASHAIDPGVTPQIVSGFGLISSLMIGFWLQADARSAYRYATEKKLVIAVDASNPLPRIRNDCPKKWLVMLHIELNPMLVGL